MIVGRVVGAVFSFSRSVCMSVCSAGISRVLIKYSGKYVKIYFNMKITFYAHGQVFFLFFFYDWEHRMGTMCPFSSLHPLRKGKEKQ